MPQTQNKPAAEAMTRLLDLSFSISSRDGDTSHPAVAFKYHD
jgi:hypothetical protein